MTTKLQTPVRLKEALYNLTPNTGATDEYCEGLVVGVVATLMAFGFSYKDAIQAVAENAQPNIRLAMPGAWIADFKEAAKR